MSPHDHFVSLVLEHPADPEPRLAFADWLESQGDPRGPWLRFVSRVHELAQLAYDPATDPGHDERFLPHVDPTLERLDTAALVRFAPTGDGRLSWQLLTDAHSRQAVAAAELFACELLPGP